MTGRSGQGRSVTPNKAPRYAPKEFASHPDAGGITAKAFAGAMERLLKAGCIATEQDGPPSVDPRSLCKYLSAATMWALLLSSFVPASAAAQQQKPNIVIIWGDDIGISVRPNSSAMPSVACNIASSRNDQCATA